MVGSTIKVVVTAENGNVFESDETEEVGVYEALEILSAEQKGAKTVLVTFSDDVTALDDIDVFKGSKEVDVDDIDYNDNTAVITLTNKIVSDAEYTVVFTPANGDDASEATFIGEKAQLKEIRFLNHVLVMADTTYKKGYAYVKGYDQFGDELALTGLNVVPGVGEFTGYDIDTGRITIEDTNAAANTTGIFLLMKEVPVFAQYQQGNEVISGQAVLEVSTQSFVSEVEFGEIAKDGGDMRADGRITLAELGSGKYYVPFETIKDQYGNDMDAELLNDQKNGTGADGNKTLFVIPAANGAFYSTGNFGTIDGQTVLWLEAGANAKPGSMDLTIVGAGGGTFSTPITIDDDPYIDSLTVSYPELYENDDVTEELEFSAVDQYDDDIDLWTFRPTVTTTSTAGDTLQFTDENHMTQIKTNIVATGATFNKVDYDYTTKTFKVTLKVTGDAKQLATFTTTTAGMNVNPVSITIGQRGEGAKVKSALKSGTDTQLTPTDRGKNNKVEFNKVVQFEDANGRAMVRGESPDYPQFLPTFGVGDKILGYDSKLEYDKFYWTLSSEKINKDDDTLDNDEITALALDANGTYTYDEAEAANGGYDVYVTLYAAQSGVANTYYLVDDQDFHLTSVKGADKTFEVTLKDTLWASKDSNDDVEATIKATTDLGETYTVKADRLKITSGLFSNSTSKLSGTLSADINPASGTEDVTVFVNVRAG